MKHIILPLLALAGVSLSAQAQQASLAPPRFHHLHLNSAVPDAAIAYYIKHIPGVSRTSWQGIPALASPDNVLVLFNGVARAPDPDPNVTAYWHFGWVVGDSRAFMESHRALLAPFYTGEGESFVGISSDTYPYPPGVPGRTRAQIEEAKAQGLRPSRQGGNGYIKGPDGAFVEYNAGQAVRFDHVHMWQEEPLCAQVWYQAHLLATPRAGRGLAVPTEATCKQPTTPDRSWPSLVPEGIYRAPTGGVSFSGVAMNWYPNPGARPLLPTRGRLMDHVGLAVADLDAWVRKLRAERVTILRPPYRLGDTRAVMIEGPSREAIELVEVK
jgi:hypothetical protein